MTDRNSELEIQATKDGSHTLYSSQFDQHYHNPNGAVTESRHLFFVKNGLKDSLPNKNSLEILEVGFGTGLNLLLLADMVLSSGSEIRVTFHSIEAFPISAGFFSSINYGQFLQHPQVIEKLIDVFEKAEPGNNRFSIIPGITLNLYVGYFETFNPDQLYADFIFHDPFSPEVNGELWTGEVFKKLRQWSKPEAILTTYCAASKARGAMAWGGWYVAREEGAVGKREMTVASLDPGCLSHLERVKEGHLSRRYEEDDF